MKPWFNLIFIAIAAAGGYMAAVNNLTPRNLSETLSASRYVELSHTIHENIPNGPGEAPSMNAWLRHDDGMIRVHRYNFPGQWGTHVDPPIHFVENTRTLEDIPLTEMILPLVVIDIHEQVAANADYQITLSDVENWEKVNGHVPAGSFVALRTDWSKRWPDIDNIRNWDNDGVSHTPAWSREVLDFLVNVRGITAIGHETMDTDPGTRSAVGNYTLETYYLSLDKYQIENMTGLDKVPATGATIVASWPIIKDGSGFPARVFAIIPEQ